MLLRTLDNQQTEEGKLPIKVSTTPLKCETLMASFHMHLKLICNILHNYKEGKF